MTPATISAVIAALASLVSAVVAWALKRRSDQQLAAFQAERKQQSDQELVRLQDVLEEARSGRNAQRDYEYEARKRLYTEFQPLVFQLVEHCDSASRRIAGIAQSTRLGFLASEDSWLKADETYYFPTTLYRLFAPCAIFRLFQRRLTIVDLSLDPKINALYGIAKQMYLSWNSPWELARAEPHIKYNPYGGQTNLDAKEWSWQHVLIGQLDQIIDLMIIDDKRGERVINYGLFSRLYCDPDSELRGHFEEPSRIFDRFHPEARPVLWRILLAQAHFHQAIISGFGSNSGRQLHPADAIPKSEWSIYALKRSEGELEKGEEPVDAEIHDPATLAGTFCAVQRYLQDNVVFPAVLTQ